jgi:hypothetical protein
MEANNFQKALADEACFLRGQIITGYSMVEYVLADISVHLELKFPYLIKDRIKAAKKIVERPEYKTYRNDFHRVCDQFPHYDELRNFMAHGILTLETDKDQTFHKFTMQRFERVGGGKFSRRKLEFSVESFRQTTAEVLKYTTDAYAVFQKFYIEQAVETFVHPNT